MYRVKKTTKYPSQGNPFHYRESKKARVRTVSAGGIQPPTSWTISVYHISMTQTSVINIRYDVTEQRTWEPGAVPEIVVCSPDRHWGVLHSRQPGEMASSCGFHRLFYRRPNRIRCWRAVSDLESYTFNKLTLIYVEKLLKNIRTI